MTALYLRVEFYYELRSESFLLVHSTKAVVGLKNQASARAVLQLLIKARELQGSNHSPTIAATRMHRYQQVQHCSGRGNSELTSLP